MFTHQDFLWQAQWGHELDTRQLCRRDDSSRARTARGDSTLCERLFLFFFSPTVTGSFFYFAGNLRRRLAVKAQTVLWVDCCNNENVS